MRGIGGLGQRPGARLCMAPHRTRPGAGDLGAGDHGSKSIAHPRSSRETYRAVIVDQSTGGPPYRLRAEFFAQNTCSGLVLMHWQTAVDVFKQPSRKGAKIRNQELPCLLCDFASA